MTNHILVKSFFWIAIITCCASFARAQSEEHSVPNSSFVLINYSRDGDSIKSVRPLTDETQVKQWLAYVGAGYDTFRLWNVGVGVIIGNFDTNETRTEREYNGMLVEFSPGFRGLKASLGYVFGFSDETASAQIALKVVAVRSWGEAKDFHPWIKNVDLKVGQTFAGSEFEVGFAWLRFSIGMVRGVLGSQWYPDWIYYGSLVFALPL